MRLLVGILVIFAIIQGEALACKDRSAPQEARPQARQAPEIPESPEIGALFEQAAALERAGNGRDAVKAYVRAARAASRSMGEEVGLAKCR